MNNFDKLTNALMKAHPTTTWSNSTNGETYTDFVWVDNTITEAEFNTAVSSYDSQAYARNRKAEYDQLNQYEMMFNDKRDSTTTWVDKINEIKGRHPK